MYLDEYKGKSKKRIIEYDLSHGLESVYNSTGGKIVGMKNLSSNSYPCLSPRDPYYIWDIDNSITSIGEIGGKIYYTRNTAMFFDGKLIGSVSSGKKKFLNFGDKVLIFPDKKWLDTSKNTLSDMVIKKSVNLVFLNSDLGVNAIRSDSSSVNLASVFYAGQGILISGSGNEQIDGYHYITGVDKNSGVLYFNNYEFGSATLPTSACTVSNEIPDMDSVCICQNRVWGVKGNKIYASKVGDPKTFCAFTKDGEDSYVSEICDADKFTCVKEYGGAVLVFSESAIYKVYGDNSKNYELNILCRGGGILYEDIDSIAEIDGELYYISCGSIAKFTGAKSVILQSFPIKSARSGCGASKGSRYYISLYDEYGENRFYIYDARRDTWYEQEELYIRTMLHFNGALFGLSTICAFLLEFDGGDVMDVEHEGRVSSSFELDEVFCLGSFIYPEKVIVRAEILDGSELSVEIKHDGDAIWRHVDSVVGNKEGIVYISIPPKRCSSFKLKFTGKGYYCIKNIAVECAF